METQFSSKDVHAAFRLNLKSHRRSFFLYKNFLIAWPDILQLLPRTFSLSLSLSLSPRSVRELQIRSISTLTLSTAASRYPTSTTRVVTVQFRPCTLYIHTFRKKSRSEYVTEETTPRCLIQYPSAGVPFFFFFFFTALKLNAPV